MSVSPKRPKAPPLNAMRAFEAAARHESFVAAAEELSVTPGAISQHIKTLEVWTGTPLFRRQAHGVELTKPGRSLAPKFQRAFDQLAEATQALRNLKPDGEFHIAALPSVAQLWLPKRLAQVRKTYPQIRFSVTALENPPNLSRELFDLSIFMEPFDETSGRYRICRDEILPVCSPTLLDQIQTLETAPRLFDQTWRQDWNTWSAATGVCLEDPKNGAVFSLYSLAVEEAKAGAGVLMGHMSLIEESLATGTLVKAHDKACETGLDLVMSVPHASRQRPETDDIISLLLKI